MSCDCNVASSVKQPQIKTIDHSRQLHYFCYFHPLLSKTSQTGHKTASIDPKTIIPHSCIHYPAKRAIKYKHLQIKVALYAVVAPRKLLAINRTTTQLKNYFATLQSKCNFNYFTVNPEKSLNISFLTFLQFENDFFILSSIL